MVGKHRIDNDEEIPDNIWILFSWKITKFSLSSATQVVILETTNAANNGTSANIKKFLYSYKNMIESMRPVWAHDPKNNNNKRE